ncbi:uncharacterized protein BDZ99DRAFT_527899 [Mytilinidion resinicola]|uniref:Uncharacterized protein n=1 Tax=Mytilinidion resinicola TaxID=574789 RepID=A0A6A6XZV8_9PEZI|nr:uncharacterized protein BDZ99DRAFT_527899 [Mytilinidion resinicola]KAF2801940.1 hypothetical protein BDZ99DRAFT_527899 [Mytilinidion resinicola]
MPPTTRSGAHTKATSPKKPVVTVETLPVEYDNETYYSSSSTSSRSPSVSAESTVKETQDVVYPPFNLNPIYANNLRKPVKFGGLNTPLDPRHAVASERELAGSQTWQSTLEASFPQPKSQTPSQSVSHPAESPNAAPHAPTKLAQGTAHGSC